MSDAVKMVDASATPGAQDALTSSAAGSSCTSYLCVDEGDNSDADRFLDVVVTSVDLGLPSITQTFASSLYTSDLHVYTVEFVVTKGVTSYCIKRPLNTLFDVLNASKRRLRSKMMKPLNNLRCRNSQKFYVPRGSRHEVVMQVKVKKDDESPQFIVWKFELEDFDVDFSVSFAPEPYEQPVEIVHARTRYVSTTISRAVQGLYRCLRPGKATLVWDNSYSRLRGKSVLYQVQVVSSSIMESATAAADALDEAVQAEKARDQERDAALSSALIVSSGSSSDASQQSGYSAYIPEAIAQQSWLLSAPINAAGNLAWKLFGSQEETAVVPSSKAQRSGGSDSEARSLLEELNGLNMQLMERMENLEDSVAKLTTERDQERSKTHMAIVEKENLANEVKAREQELASIAGELQRIQREREAWREIQAERDALLEEKHRWAMTDDFDGGDEETTSLASEMDSTTRNRLEQELGQAEAAVLRCRAELGEMAATKQQYEEQMQTWEQERLQLTQQLVKARGQRRVLVTEIRNMRTQTEGQIAVAMAEANEARMVNKRTLINEAEENEKKLQEVRDELKQQQPRQPGDFEAQSRDTVTGKEGVAMLDLSVRNESPPNSDNLHTDASPSEASRDETTEQEEDSSIPYTLSEDDIAAQTLSFSSSPSTITHDNPFRARLVAFFEERDPGKLVEVDEMLASYKGVEESLFESLELKYSFMELNQRIAQAM
ncbi:hypothetical protein PInf_016270 [Phytophthora infestans]|nr:hypothetical protein PInf_016270 [Phytophthora infestans]